MVGRPSTSVHLTLIVLGLLAKGCEGCRGSSAKPKSEESAAAANLEGKAMKLEDLLAKLRSCGIAMLPGRTTVELLASFPREELEKEPMLLVTQLGGEVEAEPWGRRFSDNLWHFDTECIEDHGAYVNIAEHMATIAGPALPLTEIRDYVDIEEGKAWLEFNLDGTVYHWDAEVDDDWVDASILSRFAELLRSREGRVRFTYLDLGGQHCILGAADAHQLECMRSATGLDFVWLE